MFCSFEVMDRRMRRIRKFQTDFVEILFYPASIVVAGTTSKDDEHGCWRGQSRTMRITSLESPQGPIGVCDDRWFWPKLDLQVRIPDVNIRWDAKFGQLPLSSGTWERKSYERSGSISNWFGLTSKGSSVLSNRDTLLITWTHLPSAEQVHLNTSN